MEGTESEKSEQRVVEFVDGRDEMNLAEFPLATIADRVPRGQKTLVFEDKIQDHGTGEEVSRKLTITASDQYGLPTALDDEVILGLIQLTKLKQFAERQVSFSRYQLIQLLGWRHEGKSYTRLEESLKRWLGVTLYYDKSWWDKNEQSWVDENFHILDNVTLYDRERRLRKLRKGQADLPLSSFTWNQVVFRSFQVGYLKQLDLGLYRKLTLAASKRMYRFLDKRFYHRDRWEFDLVEFACVRVGLTRTDDVGQLKRRLEPAIAELESLGFIEPLHRSERFMKVGCGRWKVVFEKRREAAKQPAQDSTYSEREGELVRRGVTLTTASQLVRKFSAAEIDEQLWVFDRLVENRDRRISRNPAGYLVKAIREAYVPPKGFGQRENTKRSDRGRTADGRKNAVENANAKVEKAAIDAFLNLLTPSMRAKVEQDAVEQASPLVRSQVQKGGRCGEEVREFTIEKHVKQLLVSKSQDS